MSTRKNETVFAKSAATAATEVMMGRVMKADRMDQDVPEQWDDHQSPYPATPLPAPEPPPQKGPEPDKR